MTDKIYVVTASANKGQDWIICKALYGGILGSDIKKTAQAMLEEEYRDIKYHGKKIPRKYFKLVEYSDNTELLKQIEQLQAENAALRERLKKAVELPFDHKYEYFYIEPFFGEIKPSLVDDGAKVVIPMYVYFKFNSVEEAKTWLTQQQT